MTNADHCSRAVTDYFGPLCDRLAGQAEALARLFSTGPVSTESLRRVVQPWALDLLDTSQTVGAGFVAAPGVLSDAHWYLAWWQGDTREQVDTSTYATIDYTRNEWFRVPAGTGRRHVAGPYIDYLCTDENVLTATAPVVSASGVLGVVGADTLLETFESLLVDVYRGTGAALVNSHDRLVHSDDPALVPGSLIDVSAFSEARPCGDLPFRVLR